MKSIISNFLCFVSLIVSTVVYSQLPPSAFDFIEVNNIKARINTGGDHFMNFNNEDFFEVPKNSGKHTIGGFGFWIGGLDNNNQLKLAGQLYRETGSDFYTGPLKTDGFALTDYQTVAEWDRFWRITRTEVNNHKLNYNSPGYNLPQVFWEWPAHGDYNDNFPFHIAPFIDINGDAFYDPYNGDYPDIKGDVAFYHVYNDNANHHYETSGSRIGIEVQSMVYAFDCPNDSIFNNAIFIKLIIINRSIWELHDSYYGFFIDFNIGYEKDDFIGCDTSLNSAFAYNGVDFDPVYGNHPPAQALCVLNDSIDRFMYLNNINYMNDPDGAPNYYHYLRGYWKDGTPLVAGGNGHNSSGGNDTTNFAFPGDPNSASGWSEVTAGNIPDERKGIVSFGPETIYQEGLIKEIDLAFVYARDYNGTNLSSVELLKERIEKLKFYYNNDSTPCGSSWYSVDEKHTLSNEFQISPNPVNDKLKIYSKTFVKDHHYEIVDLTGKIMSNGVILNSQTEVDISDLYSGYYILRIFDYQKSTNYKFVKY